MRKIHGSKWPLSLPLAIMIASITVSNIVSLPTSDFLSSASHSPASIWEIHVDLHNLNVGCHFLILDRLAFYGWLCLRRPITGTVSNRNWSVNSSVFLLLCSGINWSSFLSSTLTWVWRWSELLSSVSHCSIQKLSLLWAPQLEWSSSTTAPLASHPLSSHFSQTPEDYLVS